MNDFNVGSRNLAIDDMISKYKSLNSNEMISLTTAFMNKLDEILPLFDLWHQSLYIIGFFVMMSIYVNLYNL